MMESNTAKNFCCSFVGGGGGGICLLMFAYYTVPGSANQEWQLKRRFILPERSWLTGS